MEIVITRTRFDDVCTQGSLSINGVWYCFTLEPRQDQTHGKPYCIPSGRFQVTLYNSPHFGRVVPLLMNVPGFEDVEIHIGNSAADTHGCTLVAMTQTTDWQGDSTGAFQGLINRLVVVPSTETIWASYKAQ